jgi:hypothetical protein
MPLGESSRGRHGVDPKVDLVEVAPSRAGGEVRNAALSIRAVSIDARLEASLKEHR